MKRHLLILFALILLLCSSCKSKKQVLDKPEGLINRSTLTEILAEAYVIESTVHLSADSINKRDLTQQFYKELFERHHITQKQFESSLDYYIADETTAEKLLTEVSKKIEVQRQKSKEELDASISERADDDSTEVGIRHFPHTPPQTQPIQ